MRSLTILLMMIHVWLLHTGIKLYRADNAPMTAFVATNVGLLLMHTYLLFTHKDKSTA